MGIRTPERQQRFTHYGKSMLATHLCLTCPDIAYRFIFPPEPSADSTDLTMSERSFYFNPYSGELSLEFPKAEVKCPGGILA